MVSGTLVVFVLLVFALRNAKEPFPNRKYASSFGLLVLLLVYASLALSETKTKHRIIQELSHFTTLYPNAAPVMPAKGVGYGCWMFQSADNPDKIRTFYLDLANRQKMPFQDAGRGQFVIGAGLNAVSVTAKDSAGVTWISYVLVNNGAPDPD